MSEQAGIELMVLTRELLHLAEADGYMMAVLPPFCEVRPDVAFLGWFPSTRVQRRCVLTHWLSGKKLTYAQAREMLKAYESSI